MRYFFCFGLAILLSSCAATTANYYQQTAQSWQGGQARSLVKRWGAPDRVESRPNGNTVYIYQTQTYRNFNAPASPSIGVSTNRSGRTLLTSSSDSNMTWNRGAMSISCMTAFEIAPTGRILAFESQGTSCYGGESFANRMKNPDSK